MQRQANSVGPGYTHLTLANPLLRAFSTAFTAPGYDHSWAERQFQGAHTALKTGALHDITQPDSRGFRGADGLYDPEAHQRAIDDFHRQVSNETGLPHPHDAPEGEDEHGRSHRWMAGSNLRHAWETGIQKALTHGHIDINQARERGYSGDAREMGEQDKGFYDDHNNYHPETRTRGGWRPMPEKLYHVGTDADSIAREGLKTRAEQDGKARGLGGGTDNTVSVTSDPRLGPDIYHSLHEHHAYLNGKISTDQLMHYAEHPPVGQPFHEYLHHMMSKDVLSRAQTGEETHDLPTLSDYQKSRGDNWTPTSHFEGDHPMAGQPATWKRTLSPEQNHQARSEFYKAFSRAREAQGGHRDPLFISNDPHAFAQTDPSKFGILHLKSHPGAQGYSLRGSDEHHSGADSGEWRTGGSPFDVEKIEKPDPRHIGEFGGLDSRTSGAHTGAYGRSAGRGKPRREPQVPTAPQAGGRDSAPLPGSQQADPDDGRGDVQASRPLTVTWHPQAVKDLRGIDRQFHGQIRDRLALLESGQRHSTTELLSRTLPGWHSTRAGSGGAGIRIIHQYRPDNELHIGGIFTQHAYADAQQRLAALDDDDYRMQHRPPGRDGTPIHDMTHNFPADVYTHPHYYSDMDEPSNRVAHRVINRVRGNPEARVHIYRALPAEHAHQGFRPGDWVSTSKEYARQHGRHAVDPKHDWPVIHTTVRAGDLHTDGDDFREFGYNGAETRPGSVAFKGGYHEEISDRADGGVQQVQRRQGPLTGKGYSFVQEHDHQHGFGTVRAWHGDNYAGHLHYNEDGTHEEPHVEPEHADVADELIRRMKMKLPPRTAVQTPPEGLSFQHREEPTGGSKWMAKHYLTAHLGDEKAGELSYFMTPRRKNILVNNLDVDSEHRRRGIGSALMDEMQRRHPDAAINHGDRTDLGKGWWSGYTDGKRIIRGRTASLMSRWREGQEKKCPCGLTAALDPSNGWQHLDGSVGHDTPDGEFANMSVSEAMACPKCSGTGEQRSGHECYACEGTGLREYCNLDEDNSNPENGLLVGQDDAKGIEPVTAAAEGYRYEHKTNDSGSHHYVNAYHPQTGERVGDMTWHADGDHRVSFISVYDEENRRKGVATGMWNKARQVDPQVKHNDTPDGQTDAGRAWARTTSALALNRPQSLYHGSTTRFEKGTVLTPGDSHDGSIHSGDWVYATTSPESARYFASMHDPSPNSDSPVHIHRVEPVGHIEPEAMPGERAEFATGNYRAKGLRVLDHYQVPGHYTQSREASAGQLWYHGTSMEHAQNILDNGAKKGLNVVTLQSHANNYARTQAKFRSESGRGVVLEGHLDGDEEDHPWDRDSEGKAYRGIAVTSRPRAFTPTYWHEVLPWERGEEPLGERHPISEPMRREAARFTPTQRVFTHTDGLDHRLWDADGQLKPGARHYIMSSVAKMWAGKYLDWSKWARIYFAGSEASTWTSTNLEGNGDFDILIGVDYKGFRQANPQYRHASNQAITDEMNQGFRAFNGPVTLDIDGLVTGPWDRTTYVNPDSYDIRKIKPYAAYDVGANKWVVKPPHLPHWSLEDFPKPVIRTLRAADAYAHSVLKLPEPERTQQGAALFDSWHSDRSRAFSERGEGWFDIANLREKYLDQEGIWAEIVQCKHRATEGLDLAPADWSNTPNWGNTTGSLLSHGSNVPAGSVSSSSREAPERVLGVAAQSEREGRLRAVQYLAHNDGQGSRLGVQDVRRADPRGDDGRAHLPHAGSVMSGRDHLPSSDLRELGGTPDTAHPGGEHPARQEDSGAARGHSLSAGARVHVREYLGVSEHAVVQNVQQGTEARRSVGSLPKTEKCKYCDSQATQRVIHSEGMAYVPCCDAHLDKALIAAARCTPDGSVDPSNIDAVRKISSQGVRLFHGTTRVAADRMISGEGREESHEELAHRVEADHDLPHDSVWQHPWVQKGFIGQRAKAGTSKDFYATLDHETARQYATVGSAPLHDVLLSAYHRLHPDKVKKSVVSGVYMADKPHHDAWMKDKTLHYGGGGVVMHYDVPPRVLASQSAEGTDAVRQQHSRNQYAKSRGEWPQDKPTHVTLPDVEEWAHRRAGDWDTNDAEVSFLHHRAIRPYLTHVEPVEQPDSLLSRGQDTRARRERDGISTNGGKPVTASLADALHSWVGSPADMQREVGEIASGAPTPVGNGTHQRYRDQAESLHAAVQSGRPNHVPLYRGAPESGLHPSVPTSWSEDPRVAQGWAKRSGGVVHTLEPGQGHGIRMADHIDSGADGVERQWLIVSPHSRTAANHSVDGREVNSYEDHLRGGGLDQMADRMYSQPQHHVGDDWNTPEYPHTVGWVKTNDMMTLRHHDGMQNGRSPEVTNALTEGFKRGEGWLRPLQLNYAAEDHKAWLGEGNHRLRAAHDAGHEYVPVTIAHTHSGDLPSEYQRVWQFPRQIGSYGEMKGKRGTSGDTIHPAHVLPPDWLHPGSRIGEDE